MNEEHQDLVVNLRADHQALALSGAGGNNVHPVALDVVAGGKRNPHSPEPFRIVYPGDDGLEYRSVPVARPGRRRRAGDLRNITRPAVNRVSHRAQDVPAGKCDGHAGHLDRGSRPQARISQDGPAQYNFPAIAGPIRTERWTARSSGRARLDSIALLPVAAEQFRRRFGGDTAADPGFRGPAYL